MRLTEIPLIYSLISILTTVMLMFNYTCDLKVIKIRKKNLQQPSETRRNTYTSHKQGMIGSAVKYY